jgi:uncharacterized membrane protein
VADIDLVLAVLVLALGTYILRLGGVSVGDSDLAARLDQWIEPAVIVLLASVAATATVYDGADFAGWARIAGVGTGALAAALRLPIVLVVLAAAGATACLRALGVG